MFAPAAVEDITFPQQKLNPWSSFESNQWLRATNAYFTSGSGNGVTYGAPTTIGAALSGTVAKYAGGAMAPNGIIYCPGHLNTNWLLIDTNNDTISTTGSVGSAACNGAFYSPLTNAVYAASQNPQMNKITINNNSGSSVSLPALGSQYFPFVLSYDGGYAYTTGTYNTDTMVKYDILAESGTNMSIATSNDRNNGCLGPNGKMYWSPSGPSGTRNYIEFDPATNTYTSFGTPGGDTKNGMLLLPDGNMYSFPFQSNPITRINPKTLELTNVVTPASSSTRSSGVCIGADGLIYFAGIGNLLSIWNWRTNTISTVTLPDSGGYSGMHMGINGDLYLIPWSASQVVKIPINNNGRVLRPLQEMNGILGRHQQTQ